MNLKLVSAGIAAAIAMGTASYPAASASLSAAPAAVEAGSLVLKADYDGDGRDRWSRHRRFEERRYGESRRWWWWRHHRYSENHRHHWRDRGDRYDGRDYR